MQCRSAIVAVALAILASHPARASELVWRGTLELTPLVDGLPKLVVRGSGVSTVNAGGAGSHLTALRLAGGLVDSVVVPVTDPEVTGTGILAARLSASLATGTLDMPSGPPGGLAAPGRLPVRGLLGVCFFDPFCLPGSALDMRLTRKQGAAGLGVGGLLTVGRFGSIRMSLIAAPWTIATTSLVVTTPSGATAAIPFAGWRHGALSFSTSTALPGGAISLVTPLRTTPGSDVDLTSVARLTLRLVPEPGSGLLLSVGGGGLWWLARRRARSCGSRDEAISPRRPPS
jgi:hypothetical protein